MIPEFELWVKASNIDKMSKGACPLCHQWYMVAYILAENKLASFKVITVPENCPPKILKDKSTSGLFPVVVGISGETTLGSVEDFVADESSELEKFFDSFKCPLIAMNSAGQTVALECFIDLYRVFNLFLKSNTEKLREKLNHVMKRINDHLKDNGTKFLDLDVLTYADCVLLPRLQHVRIAGKIYVDYEIPAENKYLYRYLRDAYATDAFVDTCPSDPVIINHYQKKAQKRGVEATLMKETTTLHIPDYIDLSIEEVEADEGLDEDVQELSEQVDGVVVDSTPNGDAASEEIELNGEDSIAASPAAEVVQNGDVINVTEDKVEEVPAAAVEEVPAPEVEVPALPDVPVGAVEEVPAPEVEVPAPEVEVPAPEVEVPALAEEVPAPVVEVAPVPEKAVEETPAAPVSEVEPTNIEATTPKVVEGTEKAEAPVISENGSVITVE